MRTQQRAKIGGEAGVNGEWYEGGKFLPNTQKPKGTPHKKGTGKQQIAPYVWEVRPEGMTSIYSNFAGAFGKLVDGKLVVMCSQQTLNYFKVSAEKAQEMADMWNNGQRWIPINSF